MEQKQSLLPVILNAVATLLWAVVFILQIANKTLGEDLVLTVLQAICALSCTLSFVISLCKYIKDKKKDQ